MQQAERTDPIFEEWKLVYGDSFSSNITSHQNSTNGGLKSSLEISAGHFNLTQSYS